MDIFEAIDKNNIEEVDAIIKSNKEIVNEIKEITDKSTEKIKRSPLGWACKKTNNDIVKLLIENGADVNQSGCERYPLMYACRFGDTELVKMLIDAGADVKTNDAVDEWQAIHYACMNKDFGAEIIELLIKHGADVNATDKSNISPIYIACYNGYVKNLEVLISHGANVEADNKNDKQWTPLITACIFDKSDVIEILLKNGVLINRKYSDECLLPIHNAYVHSSFEAVKTLVKHKALINEQYEYGGNKTYIIYEAIKNHNDDDNNQLELIELLLEFGADTSVSMSDGKTTTKLIDMVTEKKHVKIMDLLKFHKAI
jgi:ankyrin repeat protein